MGANIHRHINFLGTVGWDGFEWHKDELPFEFIVRVELPHWLKVKYHPRQDTHIEQHMHTRIYHIEMYHENPGWNYVAHIFYVYLLTVWDLFWQYLNKRQVKDKICCFYYPFKVSWTQVYIYSTFSSTRSTQRALQSKSKPWKKHRHGKKDRKNMCKTLKEF